jgi:hypothetical protein
VLDYGRCGNTQVLAQQSKQTSVSDICSSRGKPA